MMTVADLIAAFGVTRATIYNWIRKRGFPRPDSFEGVRKLWDRAAVEAWARDNEEPM